MSKNNSNPSVEEVAFDPTAEVLEGEVSDAPAKTNRVMSFIKKHSTWFIAGAAAVAASALTIMLTSDEEDDSLEDGEDYDELEDPEVCSIEKE